MPSYVKTNFGRKQFEDCGETWTQARKDRLLEFCRANGFSEAFDLVRGLHPSTRSRFISCLVSNDRVLEPYDKSVLSTTSLSISVPEGRQLNIGVLSANGDVNLALFRQGEFLASVPLQRGGEYTVGEGSVMIRSDSDAHLLFTSTLG